MIELREKTLLVARWVAPMDRPMIQWGGVVVDRGIIVGVGNWRDLRNEHGDARVEDFGDGVILPGLVNAHVHLELSELRAADTPHGTFVEWLKWMIGKGREMTAESAEQGARVGIEQCLRCGVSSVGDITSWPGVTRILLAESGLRGVSFGEVRGMGSRRGQLEGMLERAVDWRDSAGRIRAGLSPHSPYSVEAEGYRKCVALARRDGLRLATHLAESAGEAEFLSDHAGELRGLWDWLGGLEDSMERFSGGPIRFAQAMGLLDVSAVLAHVNYCDDAEMELLAGGKSSVVYCPRTHEYFGHPPPRWKEMLARGINVAVGTDSCASFSPDLNLVDDLRLMHRIAPDVPVETLWEMATIRGARALGLEWEIGSITEGKRGEFCVFQLNSADTLREVLETSLAPLVWS